MTQGKKKTKGRKQRQSSGCSHSLGSPCGLGLHEAWGCVYAGAHMALCLQLVRVCVPWDTEGGQPSFTAWIPGAVSSGVLALPCLSEDLSKGPSLSKSTEKPL